MKIWNAGEENLLNEFAADDLIVNYTHFENTYTSISEYKSMLQQTHEFFPDLEITLEEIIPSENGHGATIHWEYNGTHKNGNLFGVDSSGKKVTVQGMTLLKFQNGKVVEEKGIVDNLSLMMQLGAIG
ncbi:ester cyclase [Fodinibius salinus]|nr:ester cyclase [Fodinibius salinus]